MRAAWSELLDLYFAIRCEPEQQLRFGDLRELRHFALNARGKRHSDGADANKPQREGDDSRPIVPDIGHDRACPDAQTAQFALPGCGLVQQVRVCVRVAAPVKRSSIGILLEPSEEGV